MGIIDFVTHRNKPKEQSIEGGGYEVLIKKEIDKLKDLAINFEINVNQSKLFKNKKHLKHKIIKNGKRLIEDTEDLGICLKNIGKAIFNKNEDIRIIKKSVKNNLNKISKYAIGMNLIVQQIINDLKLISGTEGLIEDAEEIKKNILSNLVIIPKMIKSSDFIEEQKWYDKFISEFNDELNLLEETTNHEENLVENMAA